MENTKKKKIEEKKKNEITSNSFSAFDGRFHSERRVETGGSRGEGSRTDYYYLNRVIYTCAFSRCARRETEVTSPRGAAPIILSAQDEM